MREMRRRGTGKRRGEERRGEKTMVGQEDRYIGGQAEWRRKARQ